MRPGRHERILRDLRADLDVAEQLKETFALPSSKQSRAQCLDLSKQVLSLACNAYSENAHCAFVEAISSLRGLAPFLKTKGQTAVHTAAAVEKYTVNHASFLCFGEHDCDPRMLSSVKALVKESLKIIYEARVVTTPERVGQPGKRTSRTSFDKENEEPEGGQACESLSGDTLNELLFTGASSHSADLLLPMDDSPHVSAVMSGALVVAVALNADSVDLSQLLSFAKTVAVPWITSLRSSLDDSSEQHNQNCLVYLKRIQQALLKVCRQSGSDPFTVLKARAYALSLGNVKLSQYAKDLLRSALCLTRAKTVDKPSHGNIYDVVGSVYDDALRFTSKFDVKDHRWFSEDVSAWLDHVVLIWSQRSVLKGIPPIFARRISALKKAEDNVGILASCELQLKLTKANAFAALETSRTGGKSDAVTPLVCAVLRKHLPKCGIPDLAILADKIENGNGFSQPSEHAEHIGMNRLRFLRVLEPLRKRVVGPSCAILQVPPGAQLLLEYYVAAAVDGLFCLSKARERGVDEEWHVEVQSRLDKMTGAAMEAAREVAHLYNRQDRVTCLGNLASCIGQLLTIYSDSSPASGTALSKWVCSFFHGLLTRSFNEMVTHDKDMRSTQLVLIARKAEEWQIRYFKKETEKVTLKPGPVEFLEVARACYGSVQDWASCVRCSVRVLLFLFRSSSTQSTPPGNSLLRKGGFTLARDVALAADTNCLCQVLEECSFPTDVILAAMLDYTTFVKNERPWSPTVRGNAHDPLLSMSKGSSQVLSTAMKRSKVCAVQHFHHAWASSLAERSPNSGYWRLEDTQHWQLMRKGAISICNGHPTMQDLAHGQKGQKCTGMHQTLLGLLAKTLALMADDNLHDALKALNSIQESLSAVELMRDAQLMQICSEVLLYIGSAMSAEDCDRGACLAFDGAQSCRMSIGIEKPPVPICNVCLHLGGLGYRVQGLSLQEQHSWDDMQSINKFVSALESVDLGTYVHPKVGLMGEKMTSAVNFLETASKDLKSSLMSLRRISAVTKKGFPSKLFNVAGIDIDISFDCRLESGQLHFLIVLIVMSRLYRLARVLLVAESLSDSRYYFERCASLARDCLPEGCGFRACATALHRLAGVSSSDFLKCQELADGILTSYERIEQSQSTTVQNPVTRSVTDYSFIAVALEISSLRFTNALQKSMGSRLKQLQSSCETALRRTRGDGGRRLLRSTSTEAQLMKALIQAFMENLGASTKILEKLTDEQGRDLAHIRAIAFYFLARHELHREGGLRSRLDLERGTMNEGPPRGCRRRTRSQTRQEVSETPSTTVFARAKALLTNAVQDASDPFPSPQFYRRMWRLTGFLDDSKDSPLMALQRSIGCTFDIRWQAVIEAQATRIKGQSACHFRPNTESLASDFKSMSLNTDTRNRASAKMDRLVKQLRKACCVVIGLSLDETEQILLLWRISPSGLASRTMALPCDGPSSVSGIKERILEVIRSVKGGAVKAGQHLTQEQKQEWWNRRFSLDSEVKRILSDIESEWFGECRTMLIPSMEERYPSHTSEPGSSANGGSMQASPPYETRRALESRKNFDVVRKGNEGGQLVLVLDTTLEQIPWESLPVLRELNTSVTRVPSLTFLCHQLDHPVAPVNSRSLFYVINPGGDLQRTEETFKEVVQSQSWRGSFGKTSKDAVAGAHNDESIYLFCGHGAGDQFLSPRKFAKHGKAPVALLMGCSSARPDNEGTSDCESNGAAIDYLLHGSRAVVGNLWDVSDKDIDRFTMSVLSHWLGVDADEAQASRKQLNLAEAISLSRSACRLPFLVGAAAIVIGAPNIYAKSMSP